MAARVIPSPERSKPVEIQPPSARWYEMDWLVPYHMVVGAAGFLLVVTCVGSFSWRIGLGAAGVGLLAVAWLMAKAS